VIIMMVITNLGGDIVVVIAQLGVGHGIVVILPRSSVVVVVVCVVTRCGCVCAEDGMDGSGRGIKEIRE